MKENEQYEVDIIDDDLYEEIDDEEMYELVQQARQEAWEREKERARSKSTHRPFPKWIFWLIALALMFNIVALLPQTLSIPAIDFLMTSAKLSTNETIQAYKEAVVVIETEESRGTGFSINANGEIITNQHVVKDETEVTVAFKNDGLFRATVVETYPEIDLAILQTIEGNELPYLNLSRETLFKEREKVTFIGNPLRFQGIVNEGYILDYIQLKEWNDPVIMIEAPIYRGNSGSPIINEQGEVIGVVFATINHNEYGTVGLFIPIDYYHERK